MKDRKQFLQEVVAPRHCREAIEIGTHRGGFAEWILEFGEVFHLTCVDPWLGQFYPKQDPEARYREARQRLAKYFARVTVLRDKSLGVIDSYADGHFDFVYLDALHRYTYEDGSGIKADMAWWDKVAPGGVFAGHDYYSRHDCGVIQAVTEFAAETGQEIHVTTDDKHPTWWTIK